MSVKDWTPRKGPPRYKGKDVVIFRAYPDGEVVAIFPEIPGDHTGTLCNSYMHVGQHGMAHCRDVANATRPARPEEWRDLAKELTQIGYDLNVKKRVTEAMDKKRRAESRQQTG